MAETTITAFSTSVDDIEEWAKEAGEVCQKRGSNCHGPGTPPVARQSQLKQKLTADNDSVPNWLAELELSNEEQEVIKSALSRAEVEDDFNCGLFRRRIIVSDDETANMILKKKTPEKVFLRVSIEKTKSPQVEGHIPSGYDPNTDYVTDLDYEAHHSN